VFRSLLQDAIYNAEHESVQQLDGGKKYSRENIEAGVLGPVKATIPAFAWKDSG
jgi:hypothetical protein